MDILSGGLGSLGLLVAGWLSTSERVSVWLLGRSGRVAGQDDAMLRLQEGKGCVSARRCDISQQDEAATAAPSAQRLQGFLHAGGVLQDSTVVNMRMSHLRAVCAPKVGGYGNVGAILRTAPVNTVVMFSSIASLLGGVGQGNYAAANAALDAGAFVRQAQGVPGKSVQWGAWYGVGMAMRDTGTVQRAERFGIGMVMPDTGLTVLAEFMSESRGARALLPAVWLASPIVWSTFLQQVSNPGIFK